MVTILKVWHASFKKDSYNYVLCMLIYRHLCLKASENAQNNCGEQSPFLSLFPDSRSMPSCYSMANVRGSFSGNCGNSNSQYLPCEPEHAFCGQLQCGGGFLKRDMLDSLEYFATSFRDCRSFTLPLTADIISLGLVPEGTKCGNKSVSLLFQATLS